MGTVGLFFAPLAPLVAVAAAVVFWISSWVYKYQLMFVYVSRVETGGVCHAVTIQLQNILITPQRIWNVITNRMLASLILMQAIMVLSELNLLYYSILARLMCLPAQLWDCSTAGVPLNGSQPSRPFYSSSRSRST